MAHMEGDVAIPWRVDPGNSILFSENASAENPDTTNPSASSLFPIRIAIVEKTLNP